MFNALRLFRGIDLIKVKVLEITWGLEAMTEDQLCEAFADSVKENPNFAEWLLHQTKFAPYAKSARLLHEEQMSIRPRRRWWRHWWCHVPELEKDRETDVFMVFEADAGSRPLRFALHVENKRDHYRFNEGQAEAYKPRARHMLQKQEYLNHTDFATVLLAPEAFRVRYRSQCDFFDVFCSYEQVANFVPDYRANGSN